MKKNNRKKVFLIVIGVVLLIVLVMLGLLIKKRNYLKSSIHQNLWNITTPITLGDPKDVEKYQKELETLDKEINTQTGGIGFAQIIQKARLLDYLGKPGEAIKLYEENFTKGKNAQLAAYNHNMGRLYEELKEFDLAIQRYQYLIDVDKRYDYYNDISEVYQKQGNQKKYEEYRIKYLSTIPDDTVQIDTK